MRSCGPRRLSSRSSTAPAADSRLRRPAQDRVRGRADLCRADQRGRQDRPEHVLRGQDSAAVDAGGARRAAQGRGRSGAQGELPGLRVRKVHSQLVREGVLGASGDRPVARCTTQRAMKDLGLRGISRAKGPRTTVPGPGPDTAQTWSSARLPPAHRTGCGSPTSSATRRSRTERRWKGAATGSSQRAGRS
jgi:hypothetical protein